MSDHLNDYAGYEPGVRYSIRGVHLSWPNIPEQEYRNVDEAVRALNAVYSRTYDIQMRRPNGDMIEQDMLFTEPATPALLRTAKGVGDVYMQATTWSGP